MLPDYTIIIPTFRRPRELAEALSSVVRQTGVGLEVFVVDDSPEGSARRVVESLNDQRIHYIKNPKPTGGIPSLARNLALPLARGKFTHFLDDDDIVPAGHYEVVMSVFAAHPEVGLVFGRVEPFGVGVSGEQIQQENQFFSLAAERAEKCSRLGPRWGFTGYMLFNGLLLVTGAGIVRTHCVKSLSGFDPEMRVREDWDFYVRAMRRFGACYLDRVALHYRISKQSLLHYSVDLNESDLLDLRVARERKRQKYRTEYGNFEYYFIKTFSKMVLSFL